MTRLVYFRRSLTCLSLCLLPTLACAHSFGTPYVLPIPYWIYVYGCVAVLIVTFAMLALFTGGPVTSPRSVSTRELSASASAGLAGRWLLWLLRAGASGCLLLTIVTGLFGSSEPGENMSMTLFWVVFLLGLAYATLLVGDIYALVNPWKLAVAGLERIGLDLSTPRLSYPRRLGYWPAFIFYLALIWLELFVAPQPVTLALALLSYSAITFIGAASFGKTTWFGQADFFGVFFHLVGTLAPVEYAEERTGKRAGTRWKIRLRLPVVGALNERPEHMSLVVFILFMLSSTTYDGIHDTLLWAALYWKSLLWLLQPIWGTDLGRAQRMLMGGFLVYRKIGLLLFPFLYLGFYFLALLGAKLLTRTTMPLRKLALIFCCSLIPIAIAYHFTHYCTFLIAQFSGLPWLITDPFGFGWNWLGLPEEPPSPTLQMGIIWHVQVAVILIGHLVSVALAHYMAMRTFSTRRTIIVSQLPMLVLMVSYTVIGLWILTLPLGAE